MRLEIPDKIVEDLQKIDALQSCRIPFRSYEERGNQILEAERLKESVSDQVLTVMMNEIKRRRI